MSKRLRPLSVRDRDITSLLINAIAILNSQTYNLIQQITSAVEQATTTLSSGIPVSVSIKNATFGMKQSFLKEYIQVHNAFCYICSNFPYFHGSPWRERGRAKQRERESKSLHNVRSADGSTSISTPPQPNQVCCF